jgi:group II intron reverse transcriptase/maturase
VVIDVDIASYFDTIDHSLLAGFLAEKIRDKRFMRYVHRMFKAGVLSEGELTVSDEGVPQGSICSPILANVFAHHVIDTWVEDIVQPRCAGRVALFRYADDMIICCAYERDAHRIRRVLGKRLAKYHLRLNDEKTRMVFFSKRAQRPGVRSPTFSFLGFTFYWGRSRRGVVIPKLKSEGSRQRRKLQRVNEWARTVRSRYPLAEIWQRFGVKLRGHIQYYGVPYNLAQVYRFRWGAVRILFKWLNRRSECKSFTWEQFGRYIEAHPLPPVRICHRLF